MARDKDGIFNNTLELLIYFSEWKLLKSSQRINVFLTFPDIHILIDKKRSLFFPHLIKISITTS